MPPRARARWKHVFSWILRRRHPSPERCPDGAGRLWARPLRRAQTAPRGPGRLLPTAACLAGRQAGLERRGPPQDGAEPAGGTLQEPGAGGSPKLAKANIHITLKYGEDKNEKIITGLKRISKPGLRVYAGKEELPKVLGGLGIAILSTNKGVITDKEARKLQVGGEVLAFVW